MCALTWAHVFDVFCRKKESTQEAEKREKSGKEKGEVWRASESARASTYIEHSHRHTHTHTNTQSERERERERESGPSDSHRDTDKEFSLVVFVQLVPRSPAR